MSTRRSNPSANPSASSGANPSIPLPIRSPTRAISDASAPWGVLAAWGALAAVTTLIGVITVERRFAIPAVLVGSVSAMVLAYRRAGAFRDWARALSLPSLLAFQALRAPIGVAFFVLSAHGLAPAGFAAMAGWGDLAVGVLALGLLALGDRVAQHPRALFAWNVLGLVDIALVVVSAQVRFVVADPESLRGLLGTPFPLLPLFYVPLVIASHLLLFARVHPLQRA